MSRARPHQHTNEVSPDQRHTLLSSLISTASTASPQRTVDGQAVAKVSDILAAFTEQELFLVIEALTRVRAQAATTGAAADHQEVP